MEQVDTQALNRKLAEWVGFKIQVEHSVGILYESPKGGLYMEKDLPNFTNSLDACFEWLVPKLDEQEKEKLFEEWLYLMDARDDGEYALALCLAMEKVIDDK